MDFEVFRFESRFSMFSMFFYL